MNRAAKIGREWLDTLVVALSVALCFRAYFYEPFNIPTGSMQTTLWGNHAVPGEKKGAMDVFPLSTLKWLWTGAKHVEQKAESSGVLNVSQRPDGYSDVRLLSGLGVVKSAFRLPTDEARALHGRLVAKGETIWSGSVVTGDFIFVNRWLWNFRKPRDGDVMIFSTSGISPSENGQYVGADGRRYMVQQGTHYIKRMKATPGETYVLEHPVKGRPTTVTMGEDEYFACGDNFENSYDSRYWGPVPGEKLRGVGSIVFWPISGWRVIR